MSKKLLHMCLMTIMMVFSMSAYALNKVDGVYQIGTADDLKAFAELVNGGEAYANAVLTADIDKGMDGTMIGKDGVDYQGSFDGQGHTITVNSFSAGSQGIAIFRNVGVSAFIQNLKVQGTITTDQKLATGIAVWSRGTIRGCYVDIAVKSSFAGDATHAGIVAVAYKGTMIENCLAKFVINGAATQNCGGIVGWASDPISIMNCLVISDGSSFDTTNNGSSNIARNDGNLRTVNLSEYVGHEYDKRPSGATYNNYVTNQWGTNKATTVVKYNDLADGRICYQLNNDQSHIAWVQQIGVDEFPVPAAFGSGQVYASASTKCSGKAEGSVTYSNSGTVQAAAHQFDKFGICSECGCFNFYALKRDATDGSLLVESAEDLDLAECLNRFQEGGMFNIKLGADVNYVAEPGRYIFNSGNWFDGNFNGDGHELTIEMTEMGDNASLFPNFSGTFENAILHGKIKTGGQFAGSITSHTRRGHVRIQNVFSDIDISTSRGGDNTSAGFIGVVEDKTIVENAIYAGNIVGNEGGTSECLAGICGWSSAQLYLTNCAFLGTLQNVIGDSKTISRNPGNVTCSNVFFANEYGYEDEAKAILVEDPDDITDGTLAYIMNGSESGVDRFYQKLGEDEFPIPVKKDGALIYAVASEYRCDGQPLGETIYSNTPPSGIILPPHQYEEGICQECGGYLEDYMTPVDGWFDISTPGQLVWWTNYAAEHLGVSARLTADIDMDGYCEHWANVGTERAPFYGNFDGQFHTISNLVIEHKKDNGVGLIAVMNSLPSKGFGGLNDEEARNSEGVYIKNVTLDESCSLTGRGYVALVGMTAPWAGHVNIKGVMMCGDVTADGGPNAAGVFGCVMSSACHVTIDNCGMVGNVYGPAENASFSGWLGDWAEVTNCFAVGEVEGLEQLEQDNVKIDRLDRYFARYGNSRVSDNIKNCYALHGTQVPTVSVEDFKSGALAWKANGNQFRTGYWYQNLDEDAYPFADPSHGTVIYAAEQYFSVADEGDLGEVSAAIQAYEEPALEETIATQSLIEEFRDKLEALDDATTILEFADAVDSVNVKKSAVADNAVVYKAYIDKCEETKIRLKNDDSFSGSLREALEYYLLENDEPDDYNALGTYEYIKENHTATAEEIAAETERVIKWLGDAIAEDYVPGTDVSSLIPNYDFSKKNENWTDGWSTGLGQSQDEETGTTYYGVEAWNATGDMYQTVEGMKPGYYLIATNGAFRPSNNRYSTNYSAGIYANGVFNYFPAVNEDIVAVADTMDQQNCNLHGAGAHDLAIYDDGYSTNDEAGATLVGYAVQGETGMAIAAKAGRYQVYTIAKVDEDGKLTIGIKNPGTKYDSDWTGWSALKVTYCGDDEEKVSAALDNVLENMMVRAESIMNYVYSNENVAAGPNYPQELKESLEAIIAQAGSAETIVAKAEVAAAFSDIFQNIYEGKQAYIKLYNTAASFEAFEGENLPLVEKDVETGEWLETGEMVFTDDETAVFYDVIAEPLYDAYFSGSYSTEEALNPELLNNNIVKAVLPAQDEEGFYLIGTPKQLVAFRAISTEVDYKVKAKLTADIDMAGVGMQPINRSDYSFRGVFDGQGHALSNVYILNNAERTGLFNTLDGATVKNLKLTGEYFSDQKFMGGIAGYTYNARIENCDVAVTINSLRPADENGNPQDGTHGGLIANNAGDGTVVENCLINCAILGENTHSCGGVCGWSGSKMTINNTLVLSSNYTVKTDNGNTISRNPDNCTTNNVFYVTQFGDAKGTKATEEQLASGEICWKLNGEKGEDAHWFQSLGNDKTPHLFEGSLVWKDGDEYLNSRPNVQLNAFASNLSTATNANQVIIAYTLNAEAKSGAINFYAGEELKYSHVLKGGDLMAGGHEVAIDNSLLNAAAGTKMTYAIDITGIGTKTPVKIGEGYKVNSPYGLAINNAPASAGFGQIYVAESRPLEKGEGTIAEQKPGALFAFDANFQPVNALDGTPGFYGGLDIQDNKNILSISGDYKFDLKNVRVSKDGRLFIARASGNSASSVWEADPADLNKPWTPVFTGGELNAATGIVTVNGEEQNRPAVALAVEGEGENLKLTVLGAQRSNGKENFSDYKCFTYNLGTATSWTGAPSSVYEPLTGQFAITPAHVGIAADNLGGLWFEQYPNTVSEETPALKHFNAQGIEDYSNISTSTHGEAIAISEDGNILAVPMGNNKVIIYETTYVPLANGLIYLDAKYNISVTESQITGMAFDYANNLYITSSASKTLNRYAIPSFTGNKRVTPAREGFVVGTESGDPDGIKSLTPALSEGEGAIYNMAGQRVSKAQKGIYVVDGKKVATK